MQRPPPPEDGEGWGTLRTMVLSGTLYFDFESIDCYRLFVLLVKGEQEGVPIDLVWRGRPAGDRTGTGDLDAWETAIAAHALIGESVRRERFRRALFTAIHRQNESPAAALTYRLAAQVSGLDGDVLLDAVARSGRTEVEAARTRAVGAGVQQVPTIVGDGPALHVVTTGAVEQGPAAPRIELIAGMLADDGLWRLSKP